MKAILWLTIVVIILYIVYSLLSREYFQTQNAIYSTQRLNFDRWIKLTTNNTFENRSLPVDQWDNILKSLKDKKQLPTTSVQLENLNSISIILDPKDEAKLNWVSSQKAPEGYFVLLTDPFKSIQSDCVSDLSGKRIGWFDISDRYLLNAFENGYRISLDPVQLYIKDLMNIPKLLKLGGKQGGLDHIITYIIPNSAYHMIWSRIPVALYGFQSVNIDRLRLFYPFINEKQIDLTKTFTKEDRGALLMVNREMNDLPVLSMNMSVHRLSGQPIPSIENFISIYRETDNAYDPSYRCYGDPRITNKAECISPYDVIGLPKLFYTTWDKPCIKDTDCPYFKANKNYPNNRGGCMLGGVCEMPVGTQRVAYQKLRDGNEFKPFCYGCTNPKDHTCCKQQNSPDYAFPNDFEERRKQKLKTFLHIE